ncbi:hypothetical protein JDN40_16135 [Rhodomicrobium vannielii ATCC 17100]|uniref:hypothetical protein n=1 Tax=Rhodomicrobium vannielii TaxID=1069 RepID=UPI001918AC3B|nr:hypothetical protein [Rhodomicrobium vannielii]MBJ7535638.1 hypothetical protein [Rhodomicrobium vannielii ATCC 17100]
MTEVSPCATFVPSAEERVERLSAATEAKKVEYFLSMMSELKTLAEQANLKFESVMLGVAISGLRQHSY